MLFATYLAAIKMTPEELEKRMDELARESAETHYQQIQAELEELSRKIARAAKD